MEQQDDVYPGYGFSSHGGYGVAHHRQAIETLGVTPLHRLSFAPLKKYQKTTKEIGDEGESAATNYLIQNGHVILDRNWKTKFCEIDIVSEQKGIVYFTEVKYRKSDAQGGGIAAITPKKLQQMKFAAEYYAVQKKLVTPLKLAVVTVSGAPARVEQFLEIE